jgi:hypothetical protein
MHIGIRIQYSNSVNNYSPACEKVPLYGTNKNVILSSIPLCDDKEDNIIVVWHFDPKRMFSVKSAYNVLPPF